MWDSPPWKMGARRVVPRIGFGKKTAFPIPAGGFPDSATGVISDAASSVKDMLGFGSEKNAEGGFSIFVCVQRIFY